MRILQNVVFFIRFCIRQNSSAQQAMHRQTLTQQDSTEKPSVPVNQMQNFQQFTPLTARNRSRFRSAFSMIIPSVYPLIDPPAETVEIGRFLTETGFLNRCHPGLFKIRNAKCPEQRISCSGQWTDKELKRNPV